MEGAWKAPWDADGLIELVPCFLAGAAPLDVENNLKGALIDVTVGGCPLGFLMMWRISEDTGGKNQQPGRGEDMKHSFMLMD